MAIFNCASVHMRCCPWWLFHEPMKEPLVFRAWCVSRSQGRYWELALIRPVGPWMITYTCQLWSWDFSKWFHPSSVIYSNPSEHGSIGPRFTNISAELIRTEIQSVFSSHLRGQKLSGYKLHHMYYYKRRWKREGEHWQLSPIKHPKRFKGN